MKPFIVTHSDKICIEEGRRIEQDDEYANSWYGETTYRYTVWAESHLDAARKIQAHKKKIGRLLPDKYQVFGLADQSDRIWALGTGDDPDDELPDLEHFEEMFTNKREVKL